MNRNGQVNENARWPRIPRNSKGGEEWTSGLENNMVHVVSAHVVISSGDDI